jgi:hypothetical protein
MRVTAIALAVVAFLATGAPGADLPAPGVGVFFKAEDVPRLRQNVAQPPCKAVYAEILKRADEALAKWPEDKARLRIEALAPQLPDLSVEFVPKEFLPEGGKEAGEALEKYVNEGASSAAFVYLLTGDRRYADFAWDVFQQAAKVNRWGWFPWAGVQVPHIHFGIVSRNMVLIADGVWPTRSADERKFAREVIAEKCVEPYYRLVLHTPGMGLYHLRSRNQGSNVLGAALVGSLFVGDSVPDNRVWQASLLQTFHWAVTHDIGWMGQGLESGLPGYWDISMQNLYTAAAALWNVRGIDLRGHPGFEQATWYPVIHEATVPPVGMFAEPVDPASKAPMGILAGKPIELPHEAYGAAWWFDYGAKFPASPAHYFASKLMIQPERIRVEDAHQAALSRVLAIAWWNERLLALPKAPTSLSQFTDRMAGLRSGYGLGQTYLYFNGDLFLSTRSEILATTSGMAWHFPWHQYQVSETGIETEGEPFAPSMVIKEASDDGRFAWMRAESGTSNVAYYALAGQRESYKHYAKRERGILYVRPADGVPDYFLFVDQVRHADPKPRWHAWTWHLWNSVANPKNAGRFVVESGRAVRAERPNADLWIQFLQPASVAVEQHGVPAQPHVSYRMDHNGLMMRAIADGYEPTEQAVRGATIAPAAWQGLGQVEGDALYLDKPPTEKDFATGVVPGLTGGMRYRLSLKSKKENYRVYEATAWEVGLEILDKDGKVIAKPATRYGHPDPLKVGEPMSDTKTHDWAETVQYFDAPEGAASVRATFRAVGGAHYFELGKLWLGPVEIRPTGVPKREVEQRFLTLVMPFEKGGRPPEVGSEKDGSAVITLGGGVVDRVKETSEGGLTVVRTKDGREVARFSGPPKDAGPTGGLKTNSDESAKALSAGLKPLLDALDRDRDAITAKGRTNLSLGAKVTASATRDERFAPAHVIDNQVAEYPTDGHLDYTLGITWSSARGGYGAEKTDLLTDRDFFPLYVRPTWWLLPEATLGHVELELGKDSAVDLVRLLNTSNAGLNDFATHTFRVELYDAAHKLLASKDGAFGKVFDRPFKQAFVVPKWFNHYAPTFDGMLEPGLTVPFGDGWQEVAFDKVKGTRFVRVVVTKYWGIGGGLNEVQVYGQ